MSADKTGLQHCRVLIALLDWEPGRCCYGYTRGSWYKCGVFLVVLTVPGAGIPGFQAQLATKL